jgi:hypothetical protein
MELTGGDEVVIIKLDPHTSPEEFIRSIKQTDERVDQAEAVTFNGFGLFVFKS